MTRTRGYAAVPLVAKQDVLPAMLNGTCTLCPDQPRVIQIRSMKYQDMSPSSTLLFYWKIKLERNEALCPLTSKILYIGAINASIGVQTGPS